jgi:hypothetical protein
MAAPEVPDRGDQYGLEVWQRIRHRLPPQEGPSWTAWLQPSPLAGFSRWNRLALAAAAAVLLIGAFAAGRVWRAPAPAAPQSVAVPAAGAAAVDEAAQDRILLTSVADHLERSERVLTDIMNAPADGDISIQQAWAEDLLQTSRLYRQDAADAGEQSVAMVLDQLERNLIDIVHSPSRISAADLEQVRRRIDAAALLFKVRVLSDDLRRREAPERRDVLPRSTEKVS